MVLHRHLGHCVVFCFHPCCDDIVGGAHQCGGHDTLAVVLVASILSSFGSSVGWVVVALLEMAASVGAALF